MMESGLGLLMSLAFTVLLALLVEVPGTAARPKDKQHNGLYDEWKTVPFVDSQEDSSYTFGELNKKLGNQDSSSNINAKYLQLYEKYNSENQRIIGDGNSGNDTNIEPAENKSADNSLLITPVEGGIEDMTKVVEAAAEKKGKKHKRERKNKKNRRHHNSVKKDLSAKEKEEKELKREKRKRDRKNKRQTDKSGKDVEQAGVNIDDFLKEHPDFKKNVATISDKTEDKEISTTSSYAKNYNTDFKTVTDLGVDSDSDDDFDQKDADDYDQDDDDDDHLQNGNDSKSMDESSEAFNDYYDYYDEDGDSSYSSSEERAEQEMLNQAPYDWFKQYDRMYGDQPTNTENQSGKSKGDEAFLDDVKVKTVSSEKILPETAGMSNKDTIPKTDVEPSTSPNPPTQKKDLKSTVTQPANPLWKERVETWNLIESKPVESCSEDLNCPSGRMCKFGLCLCGQPDFCQGRYKPVCGSDGRLYPSHCELHRTACVLGVHISPDTQMKCQPKVEDMVDVSKLVESVLPEVVEDHAETTETARDPETTLATFTVQNNNHLQDSGIRDEKKEKQNVDTTLKTAFDKTRSDEAKLEGPATVGQNDNSEDKSSRVDLSNQVGIAVLLSPAQLSIESSHTDVNISDEQSNINTDVKIGGNDTKENNSEINNSKNEQFAEDKDDTANVKEIESYDYDSDIEDEYEDDYESDDIDIPEDSSEESAEVFDPNKPDLVPLFCTPDEYMKFKADVLEYHCLFFEELHCDRQTQEEKQKLAVIMFNYFDRDFSGHIEKEELWEQQILERMDEISTLCSLLDIVRFDELGKRDGKLSVDEFIQAFDIPDAVEHKEEVVPLLATVGNGLEVKCDITDSKDIVWTRNGVDLDLLGFPGISVLGDGSLYLETVGFHMVGNLSCYDRQKPSLKQTHRVTVQQPPHVVIALESHDHIHGNSFNIQCHAEGYPKPTIIWQFEGQTIQHGARYHLQNSDDTLTVLSADYHTDSGTYACHARNTAGEAVASVLVTVHDPNVTDHTEFVKMEESFLIFHDDGYTLHEPKQCLTQRHVKPDFGNFYFIPDELDSPPALCEKGIPCIWGSAVNVRDTFVYVTQPRENRVVVVDVSDTFNPNQVIFTDHIPVALYYVAHLDEVWVLCWNGEDDTGSKTVVIIRNASQRTQHQAIHTQPIGNRFDQVQELFLPPDSELHQPYQYGYTVHNGQQGLFKVNIQDKKYTRAVDFTRYDCVPKSVSFVPLGGHILVECEKKLVYGSVTSILTVDYITDVVTDNVTMAAKPYVSPDSSLVAMVEETTGKVSIHRVTENGEIIHEFDVAVGSAVGKATFHKASYSHGYDLYLTSTQAPYLFSLSLENGKVDIIKDIGEPDSEMYLPWFKKRRPLVSGDVFSDYLATTAMSSMLILDGRHHSIQCDYRDLKNPAVIAYAHLRT